MIELSQAAMMQLFVVFCRVGACLMVMPGIGTSRVPQHVRLFIAIGISVALTPALQPDLIAVGPTWAPVTLLATAAGELFVGLMIGLSTRYFLLALQAMASAIASCIGFNGPSGTTIEEPDPVPALASLITLTAILLMFVTDQHWEVFRGVMQSYAALPVSAPVDAAMALHQLTRTLAVAFHFGLQLSGPFLIYAVLINLLFGLANKLTPTIPVYFISLPFVLAGGLLLLDLTVAEMLRLFTRAFADWVQRG